MSVSKIEPIKHFVRAGAGAGKTWNLTRQVIGRALAFKEREGKWPNTVVTTFTRKATQELKERLMIYCLQEAPEALDYVRSSGHLYITTMHGLFDTFLRRYGSGIGLPNQFILIDSSEGELLRKKVLKKIFNESQVLAQIFNRYDLRRILEILKAQENLGEDKSFQPASIKDFESYSLRWAHSIGERIEDFLNEASDFVDGEKWDVYLSYLRDVSVVLYKKDWSLAEELSQTLGREKKPRKSKNTPGLPKHLDDRHKKIMGDLKKIIEEEAFQPDFWEVCEEELSLFSQLMEAYNARLLKEKVREGKIEVNDLETFSLRLMKEFPASTESFYKDWDDWFIDEFQDTSPRQLKLLDSIIKEKPCYIVGDPQQSIYLFRGARSEVFLEKGKEIEKQKGRIDFLDTNYRSEKPLMGFLNMLFSKLGDDFAPMSAADESSPVGSVADITVCDNMDIECAQISQQIAGLLQEGVSPKSICVLTRTNRHLEKILNTLRSLGFPVISHSSSSYYSRREVLDALSLLQFLLNPWDDFNLLTLLRSPWVPLKEEDIVRLINEKEKSHWSSFKAFFAENPDFETGQWLLEGVSAKETMGVAWVFRKLLIALGFFDYTQRIDSTGRREANLWKLINLVEKGSREPGVSLLDFIDKSHFFSDLDSVGDNIDASSSIEPDKINLMTVHSSKGLQFDYVFVPFMNKKMKKTTHFNFCYDDESSLWSFRVPSEATNQFVGSSFEKHIVKKIVEREEQEFLRVLYVALTRAKKKLFMSWSGKEEDGSWADKVRGSLELQEGVVKKDGFSYVYQEMDNAEEEKFQGKNEENEVRERFSDFRKRFYLKVERQKTSVTEQVSKRQDFSKRADIWTSHNKRWQGVVFHRLFEMLKYRSVEDVQKTLENWLGAKHFETLNYITSLQDPPLLSLIQNGEVEWFFQTEINQNLIEGRIDLWALYEKQLWIVDYKTGSARSKEKSFQQLELYQKALEQHLLGHEVQKVNLCLVYPFEKQVFLRSE